MRTRPKRQDLALNPQENPMDYTYADIAKMIDHSLLSPVLTDEDL